MTPTLIFTLALQAGFTTPQAHVITCIAKYESNFKPTAINVNKAGDMDHGLLQINDLWLKAGYCKGLNLYNPADNLRCAAQVFKASKRSYKIWVAYKKNASKCKTYRAHGKEKRK